MQGGNRTPIPQEVLNSLRCSGYSGTADERRTADAELIEGVADAVGVRVLVRADRCFEDRTVALRKTVTTAF